ncbi:E3 ubiquitin-protein ligase rnf213-alpha-like [Glandiceps talaboti]
MENTACTQCGAVVTQGVYCTTCDPKRPKLDPSEDSSTQPIQDGGDKEIVSKTGTTADNTAELSKKQSGSGSNDSQPSTNQMAAMLGSVSKEQQLHIMEMMKNLIQSGQSIPQKDSCEAQHGPEIAEGADTPRMTPTAEESTSSSSVVAAACQMQEDHVNRLQHSAGVGDSKECEREPEQKEDVKQDTKHHQTTSKTVSTSQSEVPPTCSPNVDGGGGGIKGIQGPSEVQGKCAVASSENKDDESGEANQSINQSTKVGTYHKETSCSSNHQKQVIVKEVLVQSGDKSSWEKCETDSNVAMATTDAKEVGMIKYPPKDDYQYIGSGDGDKISDEFGDISINDEESDKKQGGESSALLNEKDENGTNIVTDHPLKELCHDKSQGSVNNEKEEDTTEGQQEGADINMVDSSEEDRGGHFYRKPPQPPGESHTEKKKNQKQQRNTTSQNKTDTNIPLALRDDSPKKMKVIFHVLMSEDFKFDPSKDKAIIRAGLPALGGFSCSNGCVVMKPVNKREIAGKFIEMEGTLEVLPYHLKSKAIEYKYAVIRGDSCIWEYTDKEKDRIVNRKMWIPNEYCVAGGEWHRYDDIMYCGHDSSGFFGFVRDMWDKLKNSGVLQRNKVMATKHFFPDWEGFCVTEGRSGKAIDAITQVIQVSNAVEGNMNINHIKFHEVLLEYLQKKIKSYDGIEKKTSENANAGVLRLSSSLAITYLIWRYDLYKDLSSREVSLLFQALIIQPDMDKKKCVDYEGVAHHFPAKARRELVTALEYLCNKCMDDNIIFNPKWLYCIPVLHFLKEESKPFQVPDYSRKHPQELWWGVESLKIDAFKTRVAMKERYLPPSLLDQLAPLFQVDFLLPRTYAFLLNMDDLSTVAQSGHIPLPVLILSLESYIKNKTYISSPSDKKSILNVMRSIVGQLNEGKKQSSRATQSYHVEENDANLSLLHARQFAHSMCKKLISREDFDVVHLAAEVVAGCFNNVIKLIPGGKTRAQKDGAKRAIDDAMKEVISVAEAITEWLNYRLPHYIVDVNGILNYHQELDVWHSLFSVSFDEDGAAQKWSDHLSEKLSSKISVLSETQRVELFCLDALSKCHPHVQNVSSDAAFKAVENMSQMDDMRMFSTIKDAHGNQRHSREAVRYGELLSHMLKQCWPKSESSQPDVILHHVLTWPPMLGFVKMTDEEHGNSTILDDTGQELLGTALSTINPVLKSLLDGSILVRHLQMVLDNKKQFMDICRITKNMVECATFIRREDEQLKKVTDNSQLLDKILQCRKNELDAFNGERRLLACFLNMCELLGPESVDTKYLERRKSVDVQVCRLQEICKPTIIGTCSANIQPQITFFKLPREVKMILRSLENIHNSVLFQKHWKERGRAVLEENMSPLKILDVAKGVWDPVIEGLARILTTTENGSMTLGEIDSVFGMFADQYRELEKELKQLCRNRPGEQSWIDERVQQIEQYRQLQHRITAVETITDIKELFKLTGNFKAIDMLATMRTDFKNKPLRSIVLEVVKAGKALALMTREKKECLSELVNCKALVHWLRSEIKDVQQLKVFVDLAMISAGETDMEVDRVKCLHQATTGYASLIFDIKKNAGFAKLMKLCEPVWNALRNDPHLPIKLKSISRYLEWLKGVKKTHGSVETSSMSQAEAINMRGIYSVGNINDKTKDSLESVVRLFVPNDDEKYQQESVDDDDDEIRLSRDKEYNLDSLKDLQSKLMLVAGKAEQGQGDVERFIEIFSTVTRLGTAYIKLHAAGLVLFYDWKAFIYCQPGKKVSVSIDFGIGTQHDMKGFDEVGTQLRKLCDFMEECLCEWLEYVEEKRDEIYYLNYYTTEQLVVLRRHLAKLMSAGGAISPAVYTLLASLRDECNETVVKEALTAAFMEVGSEDEEEEREMEIEDDLIDGDGTMETESADAGIETTSTEADGAEFDIQKIQMCLQELLQEGLSEPEAKAAVAGCGFLPDVDQAMIWYYQNMQEEDLMIQSCKEFENKIEELSYIMPPKAPIPQPVVTSPQRSKPTAKSHVVEKSPKTVSSLEAITKTLLSGLGGEKHGDLIQKLKEFWEGYLKSLKSTSVRDYLSLEHLGYTLQHLADKERFGREFPKYLNPGRPNLMVRPYGEILSTILSIYMYDVNHPLPSYNEVLLCTPQTTLEEVILLWRRAMYDRSGKIYCLVNADQLDYEVSTKAEEKRNKLAKRADEGYQLVVLCSREREDHSHMVTALDSYRIDPPNLPLIKDIRSYLQQQFINQAAQVRTVQTAASVTHNRCPVQLITSTRAGVGKSLHVKRLSQKLHARRTLRRGGYILETMPLAEKRVNQDALVSTLIRHITTPENPVPGIFHLDITPAVQHGVDDLLFNLLVLGGITDVHGKMWRRNAWDLYVVEITSTLALSGTDSEHVERREAMPRRIEFGNYRPFYEMLPGIVCRSPRETMTLEIMKEREELPGSVKMSLFLIKLAKVYQY